MSQAPGAPEDDVAQDIVRSPDVSAWKSALCDGLRSADGFHHVDHNTCVLTSRPLQGAVLDFAVVPSDSKPHVVVSALQNVALPDDRVGVHWVVVDNASPALHAALRFHLFSVALDTCHLPMKYDAVALHHGSAGSRMLRWLVSKFNVSFPSEVCPDVDALEPFRGERNRQFTGDEVLYNDHLCRASLPREQTDATVTSTKSAEVRSGLAEWILYFKRRKKKQAFPEGEVQAAVVDGGCDVPEVPEVLEQCTTPLDGGVQAGGACVGTGDMR